MSVLDRFRGQPEWQHEDPSVRASAVDDLEDDAQELLTAIALEDADPGVRSAAVVRLSDPATLGRIAKSDQTAGVRDEAAAMLREIAVDDTNSERAAAALAGLSETRDLGEVARTASLEAISVSALERLDTQNQKTISAVARRSAHPVTRRAALARLDAKDELLAVAVKCDHKDVALEAFERLALGEIQDRELLKTIAVRARNKAVVRRAKATLIALEGQPTPPSGDELRQRRDRLCQSVEALVSANDLELVTGGLAEAEREWASLDETGPLEQGAAATGGDVAGDEEPTVLSPTVSERWVGAVTRVREHLDRLDKARREADRLRKVHGETLAARTALCERLAALVADEACDAKVLTAEVANARAEWLALPAIPDAEPGHVAGDASDRSALERRFEELAGRAERHIEQQLSAGDRVARLTELASALETISQAGTVDDVKRRWTGPHAEWTKLARASTPDDVAELAPRVETAETRRAERLAAAIEQRRRREQANLVKQQRRCDELDQALANENLELGDAERWLRTSRSLPGNLGRLPTREDRDALTKRLREAQTALAGRVRELRDLVEWKQWANTGVQAKLCQRLEALTAVDDDVAVAQEFQQVMEGWRQASDVPRGEGKELWLRFKTAHDAIRPRAEAYLAKEDAQRKEHLARKVALCEEAERLAESTDWIKTAQRITELQEQWKQVGSATRKQERDVWNRFRAACGRFFHRRRDDLAERKQIWAKNAKLKEALCEKAEALDGESDLGTAKEAVRQLQVEWKTVGPVRRTRSDALWRRFRAACDGVYTREQQASVAEFADKITARSAVCDRLEALLVDPSEAPQTPQPGETRPEPPNTLAETVAAARTEWRQLPPVPRLQERGLTARFQTALGAVVERFPAAFRGTDLDPERNLGALERLCERVESLLDDATPVPASGQSPAEILAAKLRDALANNTMGAREDTDAKRRADSDEVKRAQIQRRALGMVPGDVGRQLSDRFRAACDRYFQQHPPAASSDRQPAPRGDTAPRRRRPGRRSDSGPRKRA
jgi:hypothetical protein